MQATKLPVTSVSSKRNNENGSKTNLPTPPLVPLLEEDKDKTTTLPAATVLPTEEENENEIALLFHVICGDQIGEEFLVHADCSVGAMLDFIKRRLMEDLPLPKNSILELFDENGKSAGLHKANSLDRGNDFVKQRGVYFPMYLVPENFDSEFEENDESQSSNDEKEFDATDFSKPQWFSPATSANPNKENKKSPTEIESYPPTTEKKSGETLSSGSNSSLISPDQDELVASQSGPPDHHTTKEKKSIPIYEGEEDGEYSNEEDMKKHEITDQENRNTKKSTNQEIPWEGGLTQYLIPPLNTSHMETDENITVSSPDSSEDDDDEFLDRLWREHQEKILLEETDYPKINHHPSLLEIEGEEDTNDFALLSNHNVRSLYSINSASMSQSFPHKVTSQPPEQCHCSIPPEIGSDSEESHEKTYFSESSSYGSDSDEGEEETNVNETNKVNKELLKDISKPIEKDEKLEALIKKRVKPNQNKTETLSKSPTTKHKSKGYLTLSDRQGRESSIPSSSENFQAHRITDVNSENPGEFIPDYYDIMDDKRVLFVPVISDSFDGCIKICRWVVHLHEEIDKGVKDMEFMINEKVASQSQDVLNHVTSPGSKQQVHQVTTAQAVSSGSSATKERSPRPTKPPAPDKESRSGRKTKKISS